VDFAIAYSIYFAVVVSTYLIQHYADLKEGEVRATRLEANLAQTRLRAIEAQLNPHFFFNTLQAISVLALAGEKTAVAEMLGRLSNLLRVMFDKRRPAQIALAAELEFINSYLDIHRLSFDDRLQVVQEIQPETLNAIVPAMLLQPLVENSIVHGLSVKPGHGVIRIGARKTKNHLVIEVEDSGPGFPNSAPSRRGVGLSATEARLNLLFNAEHSIEYDRSPLGGARIRVSLPFLTASQLPSILADGAVA
jgi:LytS/YehU family sensor histidine kinase